MPSISTQSLILHGAGQLLDDAASTYKAAGHPIKAARLKGMSRQIDDELSELDRKLAILWDEADLLD